MLNIQPNYHKQNSFLPNLGINEMRNFSKIKRIKKIFNNLDDNYDEERDHGDF